MTLELTTEQEERLKEGARRHGLREEEYLRALIEVVLPGSQEHDAPLFETLSPEEWRRVSKEWVDSHDHETPPLSDYAVSREGIYGDHP
jgi:hypothetical protein